MLSSIIKADTCKRILIVEDDDVDFTYVDYVLNNFSRDLVSITRAFSIDEADRLLSQHKFDYLLLDFHIGNRTPFSLVKHWCHDERQMPVMVLSNAHPTSIQPFIQTMGVSVYIQKFTMTMRNLRDGFSTLGLSIR